MNKIERIRVRPGYGSKKLLVEFCGDHRCAGFPNVGEILRQALHASPVKLFNFDEAKVAIATDRYVGLWTYSNGSYEIDDDTWGLWIQCRENNHQVIGDIEHALIRSGLFEKDEVNFEDYSERQ
jgi:hypothetical protein